MEPQPFPLPEGGAVCCDLTQRNDAAASHSPAAPQIGQKILGKVAPSPSRSQVTLKSAHPVVYRLLPLPFMRRVLSQLLTVGWLAGTGGAGVHDTRRRHGAVSCRVPLQRAEWMRIHPLEKWTLLLDLGRRGRRLLEEPQATSTSGSSRSARAPGSAAEVSLAEFGAALPSYSSRLQVALSLLLWVRCLSDVQDTFARVRMPYAQTTRLGRALLVHVFPTRRVEYLVEPHSTVTVKVHEIANDTAEQVPPPHTWDPETSVTLREGETEWTAHIEGHRARHGGDGCRVVGRSMGLLHRVQNVVARASEDDGKASRLLAGRRHRRLRLATGSAHGSTPLRSRWRSTDASIHWATSDGYRRLPPNPLDPCPTEDAAYHGNWIRGEGCPLADDGQSTVTPIFIPAAGASPVDVPLSRSELSLDNCVKAHAAILSALFIEGRVAHVTTDDPAVLHYVRFAFAEFIHSQYLSIESVADSTAVSLMPYYPPWSHTAVWVLLPPAAGRRFRPTELKGLVGALVEAAPCRVLVEAAAAADPSGTTSYVDDVRKAVSALTESGGLGSGAVQFVQMGSPPADKDGHGGRATQHASDPQDRVKGHARLNFVATRHARASSPPSTPLRTTLDRVRRHFSIQPPSDHARCVRLTEAINAAVLDSVYAVQIVCVPHNCLLRPPFLRQWVWNGLPTNVQIVSINTSSRDALYFYPHAPILPYKVGNAFRYRSVTRTLIAKHYVGSVETDPTRRVLTLLGVLWPHRRHGRLGLHSRLAHPDRIENTANAPEERAVGAILLERTIDYLAHPTWTNLVALISAKILHL